MERDPFLKYLGMTLLALAAICGVWVFEAIVQLWNAPASVPLLTYLNGFIAPHTTSPSAVAWPAWLAPGVAIFLCLMAISGMSLLTKALIDAACMLLVPEGLPLFKRLRSELARLRPNQENKP